MEVLILMNLRDVLENLEILKSFRERNVTTLSENDEQNIERIFNEFMESLQIASGKKSPVAVVKALHLLAPNFFPLWDYQIARAYGCNYHNNPAERYIQFMKVMKEFYEQIRNYNISPKYSKDKTLLKLIDEYNYSKYTKKWICYLLNFCF